MTNVFVSFLLACALILRRIHARTPGEHQAALIDESARARDSWPSGCTFNQEEKMVYCRKPKRARWDPWMGVTNIIELSRPRGQILPASGDDFLAGGRLPADIPRPSSPKSTCAIFTVVRNEAVRKPFHCFGRPRPHSEKGSGFLHLGLPPHLGALLLASRRPARPSHP